jgi:hypothetical protein
VVTSGCVLGRFQDDRWMVASRVRFVAAQLAYKPGAKSQRALLLDGPDVPGPGWRRLDQRTMRVGFQSRGEPWADEARARRLVGAWRSLLQQETGRYLQLALTPVSSPEHVGPAMESMSRNRGIKNWGAQVVSVARSEVPVPPGLAASGPAAASEEVVRGKRRRQSTNLHLLLGVGTNVLTVVASSTRTPWQWAEVVAIANAQAARVQQA